MGTRRPRDDRQDRRTQSDEKSQKAHREVPRGPLDRLLRQVDGRIPPHPRVQVHQQLAHRARERRTALRGFDARDGRQRHLRTGAGHREPEELPQPHRFGRGGQPQVHHPSGGRHALPGAHQIHDPRHEIRRAVRGQVPQAAQIPHPQRLGQRDHHHHAHLVGQRVGR